MFFVVVIVVIVDQVDVDSSQECEDQVLDKVDQQFEEVEWWQEMYCVEEIFVIEDVFEEMY